MVNFLSQGYPGNGINMENNRVVEPKMWLYRGFDLMEVQLSDFYLFCHVLILLTHVYKNLPIIHSV